MARPCLRLPVIWRKSEAVVTINAPADPAHVIGLFKDDAAADIGTAGEIGGYACRSPVSISRSFLDDVRQQRLGERIGKLHKALLVFHSPTDEIVGIENASFIFTAAKHPKSFVSLAGADHLLSRRSDASYVANVIDAWAERYLELSEIAVRNAAARRRATSWCVKLG